MRLLRNIWVSAGMCATAFRFLIRESGPPNAVLALFCCDSSAGVVRCLILGRGTGAADLHDMVHERKEKYNVAKAGSAH